MGVVTTKLKAVNTILQTIGEVETTTLSGTLPYEVSSAEGILDEVIADTLMDSYIFNTEENVTLTPAANNISATSPYDLVQVRSNSTSEEYAIRSGILYSMKDKTSTFTDPITVTIVYLLDFLDLPEAAKRYCIIRAARLFADRFVGSKDIRAFSERDEYEAKAKLMDYEHNVGNVNMLRDSTSISRITSRKSNSSF